MESLYRDLNIRNVFFCVMWENLTVFFFWLLIEVDDVFFFALVFDLLWVFFSLSDIGEDVFVGVEGIWRLYCGSLLMFGFFGVFLIILLFGRMFLFIDKRKKDMLEICKEYNVI